MIVLVTGGRDYKDRDHFDKTLRHVWTTHTGCFDTIMHGACGLDADELFDITKITGADRLAQNWATLNAVPCIWVPAAWKRLGRPAGPIRNQAMIDKKPDLVVAFPGGVGTADCVRRARKANIRVIEA